MDKNKEIKQLNQIQLDIRAKMIALAIKDGLSLQEISDIFQQPITKSRVHQINIGYNAQQIKP